MAKDLKNISAAPILDENEAAKKLAAQKALARRQAQLQNISAELGKAPVYEDVGMDKGDIGMEIPSKKGGQPEEQGEEGAPASEEQAEEQEQTESIQQQAAVQTAAMAMAAQQQQRTAQIRRSIQTRQSQLEESSNKIKTFSKKIETLQGRVRDGKKLTLFLKLLSLCTIIGAALAFVIKHIVNFFTDADKIEGEIKSIQKKIKSEENNKKLLERSLQNEYQSLNQNQ